MRFFLSSTKPHPGVQRVEPVGPLWFLQVVLQEKLSD
jgi:hypothetical protein